VLIRPAVRALLLYLVAQTAAVAVIFLLVSAFFTSWDGVAVSVMQPPTAEPKVYQVLIVNEDGSSLQRSWPAEVVSGLALPVDNLALPPTQTPEGAIETRKSKFQLSFLLRRPSEEGGGSWQSVPTTSPQGVGIALLAWFIALGVRNMVYAGSPVAIERSRVFLPKAQAAAGSAAPTGASRGRKGPPPGRKRRGPRR